MDSDDYSIIKYFRYGSMPGTDTFTKIQPYLWVFLVHLYITKEVYNRGLR